MRMIDADALIKFLGVVEDWRDEAINKIISNYPTVDAAPVVRGAWIVTDAYPHRVYCSVCYKTNVPNEEWLFEKNEYPKYCMWCGAKMEDKT